MISLCEIQVYLKTKLKYVTFRATGTIGTRALTHI